MARTPKKPVKHGVNLMPAGKRLTPRAKALAKAEAERLGKAASAAGSKAKATTAKRGGKTTASTKAKLPTASKTAATKSAASSTAKAPRKPAAKKPAPRKSTTKTPVAKKPVTKRTGTKAPATKKSAPNKTATKSRTAKPAAASSNGAADKRISGYGAGGVETVISVDDVTRQVAAIAEEVTVEQLENLCGGDAYVTIENLNAGYGKMEILHDVNLRVGRKQSLCLIGPNGAGKSTVLHAIFGFNNIFSGSIRIGDGDHKADVTGLSPNEKLAKAGIAYILQDKSVFPGMTVEENLWMGGFLKDQPAQAKQAAEEIFDKYPRLAARRKHQAKVLSGGERRLLEISRALVMNPEVLLVDEPSIGLEPRFIDMVFEILHDLQHNEGKTIIMVEQNAKKGLEFADIGYVLVSGEIAIAGKGDDLLANPKVGQLFLGG